MGNCATVTVGTVSPQCAGSNPCTVPGAHECRSDGYYWDCLDGCWKKSATSCGSQTTPPPDGGGGTGTGGGGTGTGGGGTGTGGGGTGTGGGKTACEGLNRDGSLDVTCLFEKENQMMLILGLALLGGIIIMKR